MSDNPNTRMHRKRDQILIVPISFKKGIRPGSELSKLLRKLGVDKSRVEHLMSNLKYDPCMIYCNLFYYTRKDFDKAVKVVESYRKKGCIQYTTTTDASYYDVELTGVNIYIETA